MSTRRAARASVTETPPASSEEEASGSMAPVPEMPPPNAARNERPANSSPSEVLAAVLSLMAHSPAHKHLFVADLEWLLFPALALGQCRLIRREGRPFAFVSWAFLGEEAEERMRQGQVKLRPADWRGGEAAWIIDVLAPFGGAEVALKEVRERVFAGRRVKALQPSPDGNVIAAVEW